MKCLSLLQPFATLVVIGAKRFETRTWQTDYRGPLAIHASRRLPEWARAICYEKPFRSVLQRAGFRTPSDLPKGAILGSVTLEDCLSLHEVAPLVVEDEVELAFGDYQLGRWAWQLGAPMRLQVPLPTIGRLGIYDVPDFAVVPAS